MAQSEAGLVTSAAIVNTLEENRAAGGPVLIHASLKSFRSLQNGAATLLDALLTAGCTVVVPTFTGRFAVAPPEHLILDRNANGHLAQSSETAPRYDWTIRDADPDLGAFPKFVLDQRASVRGAHPLNSFASLGPDASRIVGPGDAADVYAPIKRVIDLGGSIVLAGVGYYSMTLIHLAECNSGRKLFRRWALDRMGRVTEYEVGSCSVGFDKFKPVLDPISIRTIVGASRWRVLDAQATLYAATAAIGADPTITMCDNPECLRCADQQAGGPTERPYA